MKLLKQASLLRVVYMRSVRLTNRMSSNRVKTVPGEEFTTQILPLGQERFKMFVLYTVVWLTKIHNDS